MDSSAKNTSEPTIVLASPRSRFIESGTRVSDHRRMVGSDIFAAATDAAMLQYLLVLAEQTKDANSGMVTGLKQAGAKEFLSILKALAETPKSLPRPNIVGLDPSN